MKQFPRKSWETEKFLENPQKCFKIRKFQKHWKLWDIWNELQEIWNTFQEKQLNIKKF